jgi:phosphatidylserine/phosphatidylglycerophosphate/cardiolipin synthase-like enzyme
MRSRIALILLLVCSGAKARRENTLVKNVHQSIQGYLVKPPVADEVCFSDSEPCDIKITKFAELAKQSIDVAIFDINLDNLVHILLKQSKTRRVRILVDKRQAKGSHSLVPLLIKAGAQVRYGRQRGVMHNKFMIVDGAMLETGSFNYTNHAAQANSENQVYLANPTIVSRYKQRFERLWEDAAIPNS